MTLLIAGKARPASSPLLRRTGEPKLCVPDCFTQRSMGGASGDRFPNRTHALSWGGPLPPPPPLLSSLQPSPATVRTTAIATTNRFIALPPCVDPERPHGWARRSRSGTARRKVMFTVDREAVASSRGVHGRSHARRTGRKIPPVPRQRTTARNARATCAGSVARSTEPERRGARGAGTPPRRAALA